MSRPNIVVFLVDDMGIGDVGCYGSTLHETPNIDKLCADGMKFTQAYSACTVCSPSRAALLTGRYPGRLHLTDWIAGHKHPHAKLLVPDWKMRIDHERLTLPKALKKAGYTTQFLGKWHLMPHEEPDIMNDYTPDKQGFDSNIGGNHWGQPKGRGKYFYPFDMPNVEGADGDFLTDNLTAAAERFVEKQDVSKPFLLYFSYYVLHGPLMSKKPYVEKYEKKLDAGAYNQADPVYAGMVQSLDESVGRVISALKAKGVFENTIIVFTADNGGDKETSSGGLRGRKGTAYEGGTRVCQIISGPGVTQSGKECDCPVIHTDIYPTLLELAGLPEEESEHLDGVSLAGLLRGEGAPEREDIFWHYPHYHRTTPYSAIRSGDYKLIQFLEDNRLELYDLKKDPSEAEDIAQASSEVAAQLLAKLNAWRKAVDAQSMSPNPNYDPNRKKGAKKPAEKKTVFNPEMLTEMDGREIAG